MKHELSQFDIVASVKWAKPLNRQIPALHAHVTRHGGPFPVRLQQRPTFGRFLLLIYLRHLDK